MSEDYARNRAERQNAKAESKTAEPKIMTEAI